VKTLKTKEKSMAFGSSIVELSKYKNSNAMKILKAKLVLNEADRTKDFHSSVIKCLIIIF
jgi:hypothetical protein